MQIPRHLDIRTIGDPALSRKASPVERIDDDVRRFGEELLKMMLKYDGVGLAATQVGVGLRMIALAVPAPDTSRTGEPNSPGELILSRKMPALIINPRIISSSKEKEVREEGCLSVPGIFAEVERPSRVLFEGLVNCKEAITIECAGLLARAIQHEIDHLDGVLFVDRLDRRSFSKLKGKLEEIRRESAKNNFTRERR